MPKNIPLLLLSLLLCLSGYSQSLRILTYNVRNAKGMDNTINYDRVAAVIKEAHPDVVALQELDSATQRSGGKYVL
jgi:endonuclease/exonuclease/phosphatase family metal-dependent hydrolase